MALRRDACRRCSRASASPTSAGCSTSSTPTASGSPPTCCATATCVWIDRFFPLWVAVSLLAPALLGGLITMSWTGALTAFFWASLVRVCLLHHVTWSINSICHAIGERPFSARDKSANFWPLAILSFGESWHNMHHADPTAARHGVLRGQLDMSARLIRWFQAFGWAWDVRWPTQGTAGQAARQRSSPGAGQTESHNRSRCSGGVLRTEDRRQHRQRDPAGRGHRRRAAPDRAARLRPVRRQAAPGRARLSRPRVGHRARRLAAFWAGVLPARVFAFTARRLGVATPTRLPAGRRAAVRPRAGRAARVRPRRSRM